MAAATRRSSRRLPKPRQQIRARITVEAFDGGLFLPLDDGDEVAALAQRVVGRPDVGRPFLDGPALVPGGVRRSGVDEARVDEVTARLRLVPVLYADRQLAPSIYMPRRLQTLCGSALVGNPRRALDHDSSTQNGRDQEQNQNVSAKTFLHSI